MAIQPETGVGNGASGGPRWDEVFTPSDLAEGVLSQCGTIISMRLNNERDQAFVKAAMPEGARSFLDTIPALRNRECIICGEGVTIPIRAAFDTLEEHRRPASEDPSFSPDNPPEGLDRFFGRGQFSREPAKVGPDAR